MNTNTTETTETSPAVYVGTYAKYNSGSIKGAWIKLDGHTPETFQAACLELHSDEADPELMFQDFEGLPRAFYGESYLSPALWDWIECTEEEKEIWAAYVEAFGYSYDESSLSHAQEAFAGQFNSTADFAEETSAECYDLDSIPSHLMACIDWQHVWNSYFRFDFVEQDGFFFNRNH
jgi:antirestriction protein